MSQAGTLPLFPDAVDTMASVACTFGPGNLEGTDQLMRTMVTRTPTHHFPISFEALDLAGTPCVFLAMDTPRLDAVLADAYATIRQELPGQGFTYVLMDNADDGDNPTAPVSRSSALTVTLLRVLPDGRLLADVPSPAEAQLLVKHKAPIEQASATCRQELAAP